MSDWYSRRFGGAPQATTSAPASYPATRPAPPPPPPPAAPQAHTARPALSQLQTNHCPACGSGNYMSAPNSDRYRCFDCGYPTVQAGTGVGGVSAATDGKIHRATQVSSGGFNPSVIVGRVE